MLTTSTFSSTGFAEIEMTCAPSIRLMPDRARAKVAVATVWNGAAPPDGVRMRLVTNADVTHNFDKDEEFAETLWRLSKGRVAMPSLDRLLAARNAPPASGRTH